MKELIDERSAEGALIASAMPDEARRGGAWLVAIDLDGTTINEAGQVSHAVKSELRRVEQAGHHLLITTGRSVATTLSVMKDIAMQPEYLVCSNGAVTLQRCEGAPGGYRRLRVSGFDASAVLDAVRTHLPSAQLAIEDEQGPYRYSHPFPPASTEPENVQTLVPFDALLSGNAVRVVVFAPAMEITEFRSIVERMHLSGVTYSLGWTSWLDIAAADVTKATAAEVVRADLGFHRNQVVAVGDGHNDIELLEWAAKYGRGVAMGQAPQELLAVASEITGSIEEDGLAQVLASL